MKIVECNRSVAAMNAIPIHRVLSTDSRDA